MRSRKKSKDTFNKWKWGHNNPKSVGHWESNPKKEIHSITGLSCTHTHKKTINILTLHLKELEKTTNSKVKRSKEIIKIRAEIEKIES